MKREIWTKMHRLGIKGLLVVGLVLFASAQAQAGSWPSYQKTGNYLCHYCGDWDSATAFVNQHLLMRSCDEGAGPGDGSGSGGGDADEGGSGGGSGGDSGGGWMPQHMSGGLGDVCAGPDERVNVVHPDSGQTFTFIVERLSQASDGVPPVAFQWPDGLSESERNEIDSALEAYVGYREMLTDLEARLAEWADNRAASMATVPKSAGDEEMYCPAGTALEALSDPEVLKDLDAEMETFLSDYYADYVGDYDVRVDGGSAQFLPFGIGGRVDFEVVHGEVLSSRIFVRFSRMEVDSGVPDDEIYVGAHRNIDPPDYLSFRYEIAGEPGTDNVAVLDLEHMPNESRIHGQRGYLTNPGFGQNPEDLDKCARQRLLQAGRSGFLGHGGYGGFNFIRVRPPGGGGTTEWICGGDTCCNAANLCLPRGEVEGQ